jgi:hypothetical protein
MRAVVVALLPLVLSSSASCGPPETPHTQASVRSSSERFVSKQGRFSVAFPEEPKETTKTVETDFGTIVIHEIGAGIFTPDRLAGYTVSWADLPFADHPDLMVETTRKGVKTPPRKLLTERKIVLSPNYLDGWELVYEEGSLEKTLRCFQVGSRFYQLLVEYPKEARPPNTDTFLDSFRID